MAEQIKPPERNGAYCRARFARGRQYRVCLQGRAGGRRARPERNATRWRPEAKARGAANQLRLGTGTKGAGGHRRRRQRIFWPASHAAGYTGRRRAHRPAGAGIRLGRDMTMLDRLPRLQGLIGAGTMGSLMAGGLLDAGVTLKVYDRRRAATEALVERGAIRAETAAEAATGCAIVWVSLPGPAEVTSVLLDEDAAVISAMSNYAVLVDTTTNDPEVARQAAAAAAKRGIAMLDAPVSGRPPTMTLMAGGDRADFHKAQPALEAVAAQVFYAGPSGAGCVAKLATQYMAYTNLIAAIEGMLIGADGRRGSGRAGGNCAGERRRQPGFRADSRVRAVAHLCGGRHFEHCGEGYGAGLPAGGTGECAGEHRRGGEYDLRSGQRCGIWGAGVSRSGADTGNDGGTELRRRNDGGGNDGGIRRRRESAGRGMLPLASLWLLRYARR